MKRKKPTIRADKAAIKRATAELAAKLTALHGGSWAATIDNRARFVLIRERIGKGMRNRV
jgi:hypothetical protein